MNLGARLAAEAADLARAAFGSPIWDGGRKKWFRCLKLSEGSADPTPHAYYDLCNIYGLERAMELLPGLRCHRDRVLEAVGWLYWQARREGTVTYGADATVPAQDMYALALAPAALCSGQALDPRPGLLDMAGRLYAQYRQRHPLGRTLCVQAGNHHVLSALALYRATGRRIFLDQAREQARFLLDRCRFSDGPAAGTFTDNHRATAFSRHCYGAWALMELFALDPRPEYLDAARTSLEWWERAQRDDGAFFFFFDAPGAAWTDCTIYSVHQKGMLLLSAWDIDAACGGRFLPLIEKAMALCDEPSWRHVSPEGWWTYRRSSRQTDEVYSYELGWEILGQAKGAQRPGDRP